MHPRLGRLIATLAFILAPFAASSAVTPLVPIVSTLHHWDHHWYIWLPGDPVFEAVEVMSRERATGTPPLVWVFFTERDGPKHQVHYVNDDRIAAATGWDFRSIDFRMTGRERAPRGVSVTLTDRLGRPIDIEVRCAPDARLVTRGAGLTNQIGHSGDRLLLLFFRENNAFAQQWHVNIDGADVARPQPGPNSRAAPFPAVYSSNILVGGFPFGERRVVFGTDRPDRGDTERFVPGGEPGRFIAALTDGTKIELTATADGGLQSYRHRDGDHVLEIRFDPPLPPLDRLARGVDAAFRLSLDSVQEVVTGTVHAAERDGTAVLDWRSAAPEWIKARPLRLTAAPDVSGTLNLALHPLP
jgi:hypothetical protein